MQGKYLGSFAKEEEAAEAVAKKLRQPKASLLHSHHGSAPRQTPKRTHRYAHVYWHRANQAWQVKIGDTFLGLFDDHEVGCIGNGSGEGWPEERRVAATS